MYANLIWISTIVLEALVLFRAWKTGLLRRYPCFCAYIAWVLLTEGLRFWCYRRAPELYETGLYQKLYWDTQFVTVVASYAVCVEIFKKALRDSPGLARSAQKLLLVVFVLALSYAASDFVHGRQTSVAHAAAILGSYLSYVEALVLLVMLWLFGRYQIPFGRNLLGLIIGYSLWVGVDVIILVLLLLPGNGASAGLRRLLPPVYLGTLIVWCIGLWVPALDSPQPAESKIERDYLRLAAKTRASFTQLSARAGRALRP
jgi:hypothetical protein